jgi:hypothetical protein
VCVALSLSADGHPGIPAEAKTMSAWSWQVWLLVPFLGLMVLYPRHRFVLMFAFAALFFFLDSPWMRMQRNFYHCDAQLKNGEQTFIDMGKPFICDAKFEHCRPCQENAIP